MRNTICFLVCVAILSGCASQNLPTAKCESEQAAPVCGVESVKIPSEFKATLLCGDCQNATSTLWLNKDGTFKLETLLDKKSVQRIVETGNFTITGDTLTTINQYKESHSYKFDGVNLIKIAPKNAFVKELLFQNAIYRPIN